MNIALTPEQADRQRAFRVFVEREISPHAERYDRDEQIPEGLIRKLAGAGYFGATVPSAHGGLGLDAISHGLLCEELGRGSASVLSILTAHGMVCEALLRWGSASQQAAWLPRLARGELIAAFALSEPEVGSDGRNVQASCVAAADAYILNGVKKWLSGGQIADVFLIIGQNDGQPLAVLVEATHAGLSRAPISGLLGFRAALLAEVTLRECRVPKDNLVGRAGFGFSHVAGAALDYGRYAIGWGAVGLGQACLEACLRYTRTRRQFGALLKDHPLIKRLIANMITQITAARCLCQRAAGLRASKDPQSILATMVAKYFAATMANRVGGDAVQIHGANGCGGEYPVQRYARDAKIMEIIEGSAQILEIVIADHAEHGLLD